MEYVPNEYLHEDKTSAKGASCGKYQLNSERLDVSISVTFAGLSKEAKKRI